MVRRRAGVAGRRSRLGGCHRATVTSPSTAGADGAATHEDDGRTPPAASASRSRRRRPSVHVVQRTEQLRRRVHRPASRQSAPSWRLVQPSCSTSRRQPGQVRTCDQARSSSAVGSWPSTRADDLAADVTAQGQHHRTCPASAAGVEQGPAKRVRPAVGGAVGQRRAQLGATAVDAGADGAELEVEDVGDLLVASGPRRRRARRRRGSRAASDGERGLDVGVEHPVQLGHVGGRAARSGSRLGGLVAERVEADPLLAAGLVEEEVGGDPVQPALDGARACRCAASGRPARTPPGSGPRRRGGCRSAGRRGGRPARSGR